MAKFNAQDLERKISLASMSKIHAFVNRQKVQARKAPVKKIVKPKRIYRITNPGFKMLVVALKYGSVKNFDNVLKSDAQIGKDLNILPSAVKRICQHYIRTGSFERKPEPTRPVRKFSDEHMKAMLSD